MWRAIENTGHGFFESETSFAEGAGAHEHPDNFDRAELEDGNTQGVFEYEADEKCEDESDVGGENVEDEFLYVVEAAASFFYGVEDGGEVVVGEDDVAAFFGDV